MRNTFKDPYLQEVFERDGYVVVPFLNEKEVKYLKNMYDNSITGEFPTGFHSTMHSRDVQYRKHINKEIQSVCNAKVEKYLDNYQPLVGGFVVKQPADPNTGFDFHLDWSMVNEKEYVSLCFWTPLIDTNAKNGNLWVLKGSHKMRDTIRGGPGLFNYFCDNKSFYQCEMQAIPVRAGTAIIFDHKLWHAAPPNLGSVTRAATHFAWIPQETHSWHYNLAPGNRIEIFEVEPEFYARVMIGENPDNIKSIGFIDMGLSSECSVYEQLANPPTSDVMHGLFSHTGKFPFYKIESKHACYV